MGKVYLIGAGPGDPELLTVKAMRLVKSADVVLHDALVSPQILALVSPTAQVLNVGKRCRQKLLTQDEINSLLVHYARICRTVVRLKGGGPSIFGRAAEEIQGLLAAGIDDLDRLIAARHSEPLPTFIPKGSVGESFLRASLLPLLSQALGGDGVAGRLGAMELNVNVDSDGNLVDAASPLTKVSAGKIEIPAEVRNE